MLMYFFYLFVIIYGVFRLNFFGCKRSFDLGLIFFYFYFLDISYFEVMSERGGEFFVVFFFFGELGLNL